MENLIHDDEAIRREAYNSLNEKAENSPHEIELRIPELLNYIRISAEEMVSMNIAMAIWTVCEKIPTTGQKYSKAILDTLDFLSSRHMPDDGEGSLLGASVGYLFRTQQHLQTNIPALNEALPVFMAYLKKGGNVSYSPYGVISHVALETPKALENYAEDIIHLVGQGMTQLTPSLTFLYKFNPEAFEENFDTLMRVYQTDATWKSLLLTIFYEISKKKPELLKPHLELFIPALMSPMTGSTVAMMLSEIARVDPKDVYPYLNNVKQSIDYVEALKYTVPNLLGLIGRLSEDIAREILPFLADLLKDADQNVAIMVLMEFYNLGEMNRELLVPYMDLIRSFADDPEESVRGQANHIIDYMEGRDVRSLAVQIEEQNAKIKEIAVSFEALKEYVDKNVEELRSYITEVQKRLPVPTAFSTEGRIKKTLKLHFECSRQEDNCLYPKDRPFISETKVWNRWLKIAMSAVKIGKAMIIPFDSEGAVDAVREAYNAYKDKDDKDFITEFSEPFLTSDQQDNLVNQLKNARYFNVFSFDSQTAGWSCMMCKPRDS
jgi:hypothetical protein